MIRYDKIDVRLGFPDLDYPKKRILRLETENNFFFKKGVEQSQLLPNILRDGFPHQQTLFWLMCTFNAQFAHSIGDSKWRWRRLGKEEDGMEGGM